MVEVSIPFSKSYCNVSDDNLIACYYHDFCAKAKDTVGAKMTTISRSIDHFFLRFSDASHAKFARYVFARRYQERVGIKVDDRMPVVASPRRRIRTARTNHPHQCRTD